MIPKISIRQFSEDQYYLDKCFYTNFYNLIGKKEKGQVVLDIGAHVGFFSFTSWAMGYSKIYAVEPFVENFKSLLVNTDGQNISPFLLTISNSPINLRFKFPKPEGALIKFGNFEFATSSNDRYFTAPNCSLDYFLNNYVQELKIDLLKINIGYDEANILNSSNLLSEKVISICGETDIQEDQIVKFKNDMMAKGFVHNHIVPSIEQDGKILFFFSKKEIKETFKI